MVPEVVPDHTVRRGLAFPTLQDMRFMVSVTDMVPTMMTVPGTDPYAILDEVDSMVFIAGTWPAITTAVEAGRGERAFLHLCTSAE